MQGIEGGEAAAAAVVMVVVVVVKRRGEDITAKYIHVRRWQQLFE